MKEKPYYSLKLSELRNNKGFTQQKVADDLGITRGRLNNYEQGTREPDIETLKQLAKYFNSSTDYILGLVSNVNVNTANYINYNLGESLRKARLKADLTQIQVKSKTKINNKTLSNWENNVSSPDFESLIILADLYKISIDQLFGRYHKLNEDKKPKDLAEFLNQAEVVFDNEFYNLDDEDKAKLRSALEFGFWHAKEKNRRKK